MSAARPLSRRLWWILPLALLVALAGALALNAARITRQAEQDETRKADCIIVFGAAEYSGHPSPVLRARLDHAYDLFIQGIAPMIVTTGGFGGDPTYSEGGVGRDYLVKRGIPDRFLIAETQSRDTAESAERVGVILRANHLHSCVVVSDAYHIFRIKQLMAKQGFEVYGAPRPGSVPHTEWARSVAVMREAVSYLLWEMHVT